MRPGAAASHDRRVMFSSFNPLALVRAIVLLPQVPLGLLAIAGPTGIWSAPGLDNWSPSGLHPEQRDVTERLVNWVHRRQRRIHVYTVNDAPEMHRLFFLAWTAFSPTIGAGTSGAGFTQRIQGERPFCSQINVPVLPSSMGRLPDLESFPFRTKEP